MLSGLQEGGQRASPKGRAGGRNGPLTNIFSTDSGQTSPDPSFVSLRCLRMGVREDLLCGWGVEDDMVGGQLARGGGG